MLNADGTTYRTFQYSADGNLTAKLDSDGSPASGMVYDGNGRLSKVDGTSFVYDFGGNLLRSTSSSGENTYYPSHTYEVIIAPSGAELHTAYLVSGRRRASLTTPSDTPGHDSTPTVHYYHTDHLGSVIAVSDRTGSIPTTYRCDSFGKVTIQGPDISRYKFSGKQLFEGFYHFGARFFDPEVSNMTFA